jgi:hypothetical protein
MEHHQRLTSTGLGDVEADPVKLNESMAHPSDAGHRGSPNRVALGDLG